MQGISRPVGESSFWFPLIFRQEVQTGFLIRGILLKNIKSKIGSRWILGAVGFFFIYGFLDAVYAGSGNWFFDVFPNHSYPDGEVAWIFALIAYIEWRLRVAEKPISVSLSNVTTKIAEVNTRLSGEIKEIRKDIKEILKKL